jgi:hypothetical protein
VSAYLKSTSPSATFAATWDTHIPLRSSPKWVPLLGVALFVLAVAGIVMGHCSNPNAEGEGDVAADAQN